MADGAFGNSGQVCSACSRLLVEARIADELVERLVARAARITVGPGREDPDIGPLVSAEQHAKVTGHIEAARRAGARLSCGGGRPAHLQRGWFVEPTIFDQVDPGLPIAREEVFGPVLTVTPFAREAEALALANGLGYGLCAGVYTRDISRALRLARSLEAGSIWINGWFIGGQQAPTGGIKDSGIGRERGLPGRAQLSADQERRDSVIEPTFQDCQRIETDERSAGRSERVRRRIRTRVLLTRQRGWSLSPLRTQ